MKKLIFTVILFFGIAFGQDSLLLVPDSLSAGTALDSLSRDTIVIIDTVEIISQKKDTLTQKVKPGQDGFDKIIRYFNDIKITNKLTLFVFLEAILLILAAWVISRLLDKISGHKSKRKPKKFFSAFITFLKIIIWISVLYMIGLMAFLEVQIFLWLIAILLIIIITAASVPFFRNIVGGFYISIAGTFREGDQISIDKYNGKVKSINWRYVVIIDEENSQTSIPNSVFLKKPVKNINLGEVEAFTSIKFEFPAEYDIREVTRVLREAGQSSPYAHNKMEPKVYLTKTDFVTGKNYFEIQLYVIDSKFENLLTDSINSSIVNYFKSRNEQKPKR